MAIGMPKERYYVKFSRGDSATPLGYQEKGGGSIATLKDAEARKSRLERNHPGCNVRIFRSETNWVEVLDSELDA